MVRNLFVIHIPGFGDSLKGTAVQDFLGKLRHGAIILKAADILIYLLGYSGGQHPGIGPGIGDHLLLVKLLDYLKGFIRADFKHFGTVVLQFSQVVEKGRILCLLLLFLGNHHCFHGRLFP